MLLGRALIPDGLRGGETGCRRDGVTVRASEAPTGLAYRCLFRSRVLDVTTEDDARRAVKAAADADRALKAFGGTTGLGRLMRQLDLTVAVPKLELLPEIQAAIAKAVGTSELTQAFVTSAMPKFDLGAYTKSLMFQSPGYARLADQITASLPKFTLPDFAKITIPRFLPPNLRGLDFDLDLLTTLAGEGITLYRVPGRTVTKRLLYARDKTARRAILGRALPQILDDCDAVLDVCSSARVRESLLYTRAAIASARAGHVEAAQALLTNTLDTTLGLLPDRKAATAQHPKVRAALDDEGVGTFLVLAPIWHAHGQYWPERGELIPRVYSRHASTHGVSRRQYGPRNSAQAVLLLTALIGYLDEEVASR